MFQACYLQPIPPSSRHSWTVLPSTQRAEGFCRFGHGGAEFFGRGTVGFKDTALPPADSISPTSWRALSSELEYVKATDAPCAASRRTMPAAMPLEPPVTRATLPLNDFVCIAAIHILQLDPCTLWMILSRMRIQRGGINCSDMCLTHRRTEDAQPYEGAGYASRKYGTS
jgi:hypothetical protein